jgi:hypothetical protein
MEWCTVDAKFYVWHKKVTYDRVLFFFDKHEMQCLGKVNIKQINQKFFDFV